MGGEPTPTYRHPPALWPSFNSPPSPTRGAQAFLRPPRAPCFASAAWWCRGCAGSAVCKLSQGCSHLALPRSLSASRATQECRSFGSMIASPLAPSSLPSARPRAASSRQAPCSLGLVQLCLRHIGPPLFHASAALSPFCAAALLAHRRPWRPEQTCACLMFALLCLLPCLVDTTGAHVICAWARSPTMTHPYLPPKPCACFLNAPRLGATVCYSRGGVNLPWVCYVAALRWRFATLHRPPLCCVRCGSSQLCAAARRRPCRCIPCNPRAPRRDAELHREVGLVSREGEWWEGWKGRDPLAPDSDPVVLLCLSELTWSSSFWGELPLLVPRRRHVGTAHT